MKKIILSIALPFLLGLGLAPQAEAGYRSGCGSHTWVSGYTRCGCPIYSQRYVAGYNHCGQPVYRVRVVRVAHRCHVPAVRPYHQGCGGPSYTRGLQPNYRAWSVLPAAPLPRLSFGRDSVHGVPGCR